MKKSHDFIPPQTALALPGADQGHQLVAVAQGHLEKPPFFHGNLY